MKFYSFHLIPNIMKKYLALLVLLLPVLMIEAQTKNKSDAENTLTIELKDGKVVIELSPMMPQSMLNESRNLPARANMMALPSTESSMASWPKQETLSLETKKTLIREA